MTAFRDLTGERIGRLTALRVAAKRTAKTNYKWLCRCDCGRETVVGLSNLGPSGHTRSCGCLQEENRFKHGHAVEGQESPTYRSWQHMIARCTNENSDSYSNYGGRGITVCDRWIGSFENFLADMGERPANMTLNRIDNEGNYEPNNCEWASHTRQGRNRRNNRVLTYDGRSMTLTEFALEFQLPRRALAWRLNNGWDLDKALTKPLGVWRKS